MFKQTSSDGFGLTVTARTDGTLETAYLRIYKGQVARTEELIESALLLDFDDGDQLIGIEILAPVKIAQVLELAERLDAPQRASFRNFLRSSAPPALISA